MEESCIELTYFLVQILFLLVRYERVRLGIREDIKVVDNVVNHAETSPKVEREGPVLEQADQVTGEQVPQDNTDGVGSER